MTGARVLLAHGNADCLTIYGSILAFDGFVVESVTGVAAALDSLASAHTDVVVTDLYIPGSGDECLVRVMKASPALAHIPVVVLTGWTTPQHREFAFDLGAERFLPLPVQPRELSAIVAEITRSLPSPSATILTVPASPERQLSDGA